MAQEYSITMVERWTFLNAQRNPTDGYRVTFLISDLGITDHIVIAETAYGPDNVKSAIQDKVKLHKALLGQE